MKREDEIEVLKSAIDEAMAHGEGMRRDKKSFISMYEQMRREKEAALYGSAPSYVWEEGVRPMSATAIRLEHEARARDYERRAEERRRYPEDRLTTIRAGAGRPAGHATGLGSSGYITSSSSDPYRMVTYTVSGDYERGMVKRRYMGYDVAPSHAPSSPMTIAAPSPAAMRFVQVKTLSDGVYPEIGMLVEHEGVTFEIERIEIETPSWRPIAVGHAVSDTGMFMAGRLYIRAPLDELQPAPAKEKVA